MIELEEDGTSTYCVQARDAEGAHIMVRIQAHTLLAALEEFMYLYPEFKRIASIEEI